MERAVVWRSLPDQVFDLLVIGGGITGAGVAREAALRGLKVLLAEQGDFAAGTSSRSTKLVHGGLRYLRQFRFLLVREGVTERQHLLQMAPHLVRPLPFLFPVYRGDPDPLWAVGAALTLYDWFAGRRRLMRHQRLDVVGTLAAEPALRRDRLAGSVRYYDCVTDDARLTLATLAAAVPAGAWLLNHAPVVAFRYGPDGRVAGALLADAETGLRAEVQSARVLNATGPWLDQVRRLDNPAAPPSLRLTKGAHLAFPQDRLPLRQAVVVRGPDRRLMFAVPTGDLTYIGTTDTDFDGDPAAVSLAAEDAGYILQAAQMAFPAAALTEADVHSAWAGLRPLLAGTGSHPSELSRDYRLLVSASGLVSVGGGKLTTYRKMAVAIVDSLFPDMRGQRQAGLSPLPGGADHRTDTETVQWMAQRTGLPAPEVAVLTARYGSEVGKVLEQLQPRDLEQSPRLARLKAELRHAVRDSWVLRLEDFLARRTSELLFGPHNGLDVAGELAAEMRLLLGWTAQRTERECAAFAEQVAAMFAWRGS